MTNLAQYFSLNSAHIVEEKQSSFSKLKSAFLAILFALIFVNIPWEIIKGAGFTDIENYIRRFQENINVNFLISKGGLIEYITSEHLWVLFILQLKSLGAPLLFIFKSISFFSISIIAYFTFRKSYNIVLPSILLLNPLLIDFVMSQIRNSFALSVIILGMMWENKWGKYLLLVCSTMLHSSSVVIIILIFLLNKIHTEDKLKNLGRVLVIGIFSALTLSWGKEYILSMIGDRRADIEQPQSSILYSVFWYFIFG